MLLHETETKEMAFNTLKERDKAKELYESLGWEVIEFCTKEFPVFNAKGNKSILTRFYLTVSRHLNFQRLN